MKIFLLTISSLLSYYSNAITCYRSIEIKSLGEGDGYTSRYVTRINGQLFYKSTGLNSSLPGIYFPIYGILSHKKVSPFWYIKPGYGTIEVDGQHIETQTVKQIWNSYIYSDFGTFMKWHDEGYIEKKLQHSEAQLRFGGYEPAKISYTIADSNFSGNLANEFIAELNSYFENKIKIKKNITINTSEPRQIFEQSQPNTFETSNILANEINRYIENSPSNWACSMQNCCEIY